MPQGPLAVKISPPLGTPTDSQALLTTVGAGTITAAMILARDVLRSGPTAAFTDTTDTAAALIAAWPLESTNSSLQLIYQNTTAFAATLAGGVGVTMSGNLIVSANMWARILVVITGASTVTMYVISMGQANPLPDIKYTTSSVTTGSMAAGLITGAKMCVWLSSNATPSAQLVRTAAQLLADTPNGAVGQSTFFRIIQSGAGTLTVTADGGGTVTLTGTMTVPQNTFRDFMLTFNTATTATVQSIGAGDI